MALVKKINKKKTIICKAYVTHSDITHGIIKLLCSEKVNCSVAATFQGICASILVDVLN